MFHSAVKYSHSFLYIAVDLYTLKHYQTIPVSITVECHPCDVMLESTGTEF